MIVKALIPQVFKMLRIHKAKRNYNVLPLAILAITFVIPIQFVATAFIYGQHFPNGKSAVDYIYGINGTWKQFIPLNYIWNYYEQYATSTHPFNKSALITAANGSAFYTARDANGYLLCDWDHDLEINLNYCKNGSAFHEHNGIKAQGVRSGDPFTQFWLDDNWLARYMSLAYLQPKPVGLVEQNGFLRWRVMGDDTSNWTPYNQRYFDTLALDGLYYLSMGDVSKSVKHWDKSLELSDATWNEVLRGYEYPGINENYHMGLWKVLTEMLLGNPEIPPNKNDLMFQHSVSLREQIIKNQEIDKQGNYIGWISNIGSDGALINTESVSCCVLGLGANAKFVFEVLPQSNNTRSQDRSGSMRYAISIGNDGNRKRTKGPGFLLAPGNYSVGFIVRANNPPDVVFGRVKVVGVTTNDNYGDRSLTASDFGTEGKWNRIELNVIVGDSNNLFDFQIEWDEDKVDFLDISAVIVK